MSNRRRGIYLLPNLFTTGALFAGFYSIIASINHQAEVAAIAIFVAMILDGMDGRIARLTNTQSDFGVQYDSLSDMVSFGVAPALAIYQWILLDAGEFGWLAAFIYTASAALRLSRYNTQAKSQDKRFFQGLPSPLAAAVIASIIWCGEVYELTGIISSLLFCLLVTVTTGLLMVSNIRYHSFKELDLKGKVPFFTVLIIVLTFVLIAIKPPLMLFILAITYTGSGPALTLLMLRKHRETRKTAEQNDTPKQDTENQSR